MKIRGNMFSIFVGIAMAVIVTVALLLGGCPAADSGNNGNTTVTYPGAPTIVSLTPGDGQVTVVWTAPADNGGADITGYNIYYSETQGIGKNGTKVDTGNVTEFSVIGLTNGTEYYFVITAANKAGEGAVSGEESAIPSATASVPGVPTIVSLTPGNGQVTVTWIAPANNGGAAITGYFIYYSETQGSGTNGTKVDVGDVKEYDVTGLTNGITYYFTVTAANSVGESVSSDEQDAVPVTVPDAPTGIILTSGNQKLTVAWTAPADNGGAVITGYYIYYSVISGDGKNGTKVDAGNVTEFDVSGLTNGTTYYFVVTAVNSVGESVVSEEQTTAPAATVPGAPTIVSLTPGDGQVTIAWTAPANDGGEAITGYHIYYSVSSGDATDGTKVDAGNVTEFVVSNLENGSEYFFVVTATNSVGEGATSAEASTIPSATATVPDAPTGLKLTPGDGQVTVAWTPPTNNGGGGITGYYIYYSETQGSGTGGTQIDAGNVTEYIVSGLINGTMYYFVVTATNSEGEGSASDEENAIPPTVPDAPTIVSLTPGNQQVSVAWTAPTFNGGADITGYYIYYSENSGDGTNGIKVDAGNVTEYVVGGLTNGETYYFVVTAVNAKGESALSIERNAIPAATVPGAPIMTLKVRYQEVTVAWTAPTDDGGAPITGYNIYYSETRGAGKNGLKVEVENVMEYVVSNLLFYKVYYFVVTAVNSVGEGEVSEEKYAAPLSSVPDAPTIVSLTPGVGEVTLTWTAPEYDGGAGITGYNIYYSEIQGSGKSGTKINVGTDTSFVVSGLTNGKTYYFIVTAVNHKGDSAASGEKFATPAATYPDAPTLVSLTSGNQQIMVGWTVPAFNGGTPITGYYIYYSENSGDGISGIKVDAGDVTEYVVSGLTNGSTYYFVVTAVNVVGESVPSVEQNAIPATVPGKPSDVIAEVSGIGEITVSWSAPVDNGGSEITEYRVYWGISTGFTRDLTNSQNTADITNREMVFQILNVGTEYYFVVVASNLAGEGDASAEVSVRAATVPGYPTVVSADLTANGEITVTWSPPIDNGGSPITEYRVYWTSDTNNKVWSIERKYSKATPDGTTTSLVIRVSDGLILGTEYLFYVSATNASGEVVIKHVANQLNYKEATLLTVPDSPTLDSVSLTSTAQQLRVSWTAPENDGGTAITQYTVYWSTSSGFDTTSAIGYKIINVLETETLVDGLTIGTAYYFVITATNDRGKSKASNEKSATPTQISSLITALTLTIDSKDYPVTFTGASAIVDIDAMATMATVKAVTLIAGASGLEVNNELTISKGVITIPITASDGSTREHIIYFRNPQITISAEQLKIVDGSKTDGTKKLPSQFMVFDISTEATVSSQYNVEFLLVKEGSTAPTTLENFRKTVSMHSDRENVLPSADIDVPLAYKSALFPTDKTSLYLAYDSEGNYPLEQNTSYTLYAVQPQSTDSNPVSLGNYTTGAIVNLGSATVYGMIESPATASINGKYFMTGEQLLVFVGVIGFEITSSRHQLKGPPSLDLIVVNSNKVTGEDDFWFMDKKSTPKPGWYSLAFKPMKSYYNAATQQSFQFDIDYQVSGEMKFNLID